MRRSATGKRANSQVGDPHTLQTAEGVRCQADTAPASLRREAVVLAALDRLGLWLHGRSGLPWYRDGRRPASAAGFDELQAVFYSTKRHVIERRRAEPMLRDDEHDGAPPRVIVDLGAGQAVITRATRSPSTGA